MIPDRILEEVRERADIVEVISEHVQLKRAGKEFKALCPFHQEKTPSFYVVPGKGFYKCFGCGESGDVFGFLMKHVGLGFQEAVEQVAGRVGVEIPKAGERPEDDVHRPLREAVAFAADFFRKQLWDEEAGERPRGYLERRGIDRDAAERFLLGYAPDSWRALREAAHGHEIEDAVLERAGLIKTSERADEPYDRFRDRLIFPITDVGGRVIAFGGRVLAPSENAPKYLNSPETPLYHKGRTLYGLKWSKAAIRREGAALVVEGYMDYVSLAARGVEHVVATLGTAMTPEQAGLLARYAKQALILYDSDTAGLRATFRSGDELLRAGVHPLVVSFPAGEDPDSVVRAGGAEALAPYLDDAVDVLDRKIQILDERAYFEDVDGIRKALDGLLPSLRAAADPALRDIYVDRVAHRTGVRRETIEREIRTRSRGRPRPVDRRAQEPEPRADAAERKLLLLLVQDTDRIAEARRTLEPTDFRDSIHRELFAGLSAMYDDGATELSAFSGSPEATALLERLRGSPEELTDTDRIFWDTVGRIRHRALRERLEELQQRIALGGEETPELLAELATLKKELPASWSGWGRK